MELDAAEARCRELMVEYGFGEWSFRWMDSEAMFGMCQPGRQAISLSRHLVRLNPEAQVEDTIRHEIAHALAWRMSPSDRDAHGRTWVKACALVGARPVRCYGAEVVTPPARYVGHCTEGCTAKIERRTLFADSLNRFRCGKCRVRVRWFDTREKRWMN
jgi:predicted SprT family Zn-dependent metalloprotease